jgi:hypothetical protein
MSTQKGGAISSGAGQGGYTTSWRLTVESNTLQPQTYGELVKLYGDQLRLWDFFAWAKRIQSVKGRTIQVLEEGFIHDTLDVATQVSTSVAGADITVVSAKNVGRIGFDVHIPAKYAGTKLPVSYKITAKAGPSGGNYTYTLSPWNTTYQVAVAIPVGQKLIVGASSYAPGEGQPASMRRSWYSHNHYTRIMKETLDIEGGQQALQEWAELSQATDGSTLKNRSLNETEFRLRIQQNDHLIMGQQNNNTFVGSNKAGESNAVPSDNGLLYGMLASAMRQYYTGAYTKDNFDVIKFLLASQGVGSGRVNFLYGQELGLGIENSGLEFIREFSGGTDLKTMADVGFIMKSFTKNGITNILTEIPEFSNPVMYGANGYNFETLGMIFPDAKVTAGMNSFDMGGRSMGAYEKKPLNHVTLGYLNNNGEDRKLIVGDAAGVNGLGYKFTNEYDQSTWYMLTEMSVFLLALNQSILVLKSD